MGPYEALWGHTEPYRTYRTIRHHMEPYEAIQDRTGPYGTIQDHTVPYRTNRSIKEHTRPYFLIDQNSIGKLVCILKLFVTKCPNYSSGRGQGCEPSMSIQIFCVHTRLGVGIIRVLYNVQNIIFLKVS